MGGKPLQACFTQYGKQILSSTTTTGTDSRKGDPTSAKYAGDVIRLDLSGLGVVCPRAGETGNSTGPPGRDGGGGVIVINSTFWTFYRHTAATSTGTVESGTLVIVDPSVST